MQSETPPGTAFMLARLLRLRVILSILGLSVLLQMGIPIRAFADGAPHSEGHESDVESCSQPGDPMQARCSARRRTDATGVPAKPGTANPPTAGPAVIGNGGAYDPAYLQSAYNLATAASNLGAGATVAIVDAYDDPSAESDLASYRSFFGLPPCTTANGCFNKVNQNGVQGSYPVANSGWAQEISLDVDMVSAICPKCSILLVEATSATFANLGTAVNTASSLGAKAISNSYGASEFSSETSYDSYYNHPAIAVTVSSGDSGYGSEYPASSPFVTAVGGTTLNQSTNTGSRSATETVWSGGGSGCSAYETKPSWQHDAGCSKRTVVDVAAVADPATGVWVYDAGWFVFGGTSVSSPIVASIYALSGGTASSNPYSNTGALFDITAGSNGNCGGTYLCTAIAGYDGPTGLGAPNGYAAFSGAGTGTTNSIGFNSAAQTLTAGNASAGMTVQLLANGVPQAPTSATTVTLSSNSSGGAFSSSASGPWTATVGVTTPTSSSTSPGFYYKDTRAGSPLLTASATGYVAGTQTETVGSGPLATIVVSPTSATVAEGSTRVFSATGADAFANPVSVATAAWSGSSGTPGSVSPLTGSSTTFTASSTTTGSGTVIAAVGSVSGSATVNVTTAIAVPGAPTSLTATADASRGIDLRWNAPTSNGGSTITSYRIYRGGSSGAESFLVSVTCSGATCSYHDSGARRGRRFFYKVAAVNSAGTGPMSNEANAVAR